MSRNSPHRGTRLDDFLAEEGITEAAKAAAVARVAACQLAQEKKRQANTRRSRRR
jgi:hypothetical protein